MKNLIITLAALGLCGAVLADEGQEAAPQDAMDDVILEVEGQAASEDRTQSDEGVAKAASRKHCLRYTGTRIRKPDSCIELPGHVHEQDELTMTGERDAAEALRRLDPSVNVRR